MKNEFDREQDLSLPLVSIQDHGLELSPRQTEIYRNLEAIGPEIAAFYFSGLKVLQDDDLEVSSYLLAHIAREIEGGLRDVLSSPQNKRKMQKQLRKEELGDLRDRIGHIASILDALDIDDLQAPIAKKWIEVATKFHQFAHRHGAWESPRAKEAFVPLWHQFEEVLVELVGAHFNLLDRLDRILKNKEPTEKILKTLPNLLKSDVRRAYFFNKLESTTWLKPLRDTGWFHPERQPPPQEVPDQPGYYLAPVWYPVVYVERVANHTKEHPCEETFNTIAEIVTDIVTYTADNQQRVMHPSTVWQLVKIINTLPIEHIERQHITFLGQALQRGPQLLIENEIEETFLPKLLNTEAKELILVLLEVMIRDPKMVPILEKQTAAIVKLCGTKAAQIALKCIQDIIAGHPAAFQIIQPIETDSSQKFYFFDELLVRFTCNLLRFAEPHSITETLGNLLQESDTIFKQIALNVIKHHYDDLKGLFWEWQGNPLDEIVLKPEIYQLIQTNCRLFDEDEIDRVLYWIESQQDMEGTDEDDARAKGVAYRKREWLSALMETGNEKVISAYQKYEEINPAKLERPGLVLWSEKWKGETSPTTIEQLSGMSNKQIAVLLNGFEDKGASGPSVPTEWGLADTFEEFVGMNPQRFADDLQVFQGVRNFYQCRILRGFLRAWRDKREFDWAKLLNFIHQLVSSERFWDEHHELSYRGHSKWVFAVAELIESGTKDSAHAFDPQLLPLAEKILLILVEKVELRPSTFESLPMAVANSDRGSVFSAMMHYARRFAHANGTNQADRWPQAIKADITRRLDRNIEPSFEFSFMLGAYLTYLLYLDKTWLVENIDRIFPKQDEYHWHVVLSGYLFYSRQRYEPVYFLLKEHGHYQKAITSDFCRRQIDAKELPQTPVVYLDSQQMSLPVERVVRETLVSDICLGWVNGLETLDEETGLIYQLIDEGEPNLLSTLIHFFWRKRDNLPEEMEAKVIPTWRALFEALSKKGDVEKYGEVLSSLSGWVALVDTIDAEVMEWLKMSTKYIRGLTDSAFFVEELLPHTTKTPAEVGEIYLGMLTHNVYPYHDQEHIQEIVRILYNTGHKEVADQICNLYGKAGFDFLRSLYDENQN